MTNPTDRDTLPGFLKDLDRRLRHVEQRPVRLGAGDGGGGTPGPPGPAGPAGPGVAPGGTAGQILAKIDGTDYNTEWIDPPTGGGGDSVDEVYVGTSQPADPTGVLPKLELWYDPDAVLSPISQAYTFTQAVASTVWVIDHNLPFQPNVTATDTADDQIEGTVVYTSPTRVTITFSAPTAGTAYLS